MVQLSSMVLARWHLLPVFVAMLLCAVCKRPQALKTDARADEVSSPEQVVVAEATDDFPCEWRVEDDRPVHPAVEERNLEGGLVEADLDGRTPIDIIANIGACGSWGDCEFVVLQACDNGMYRAVWGPDYAQRIDVGGRPDGAELANLVLGGRTAQAACDRPLETVLHWTAEGWHRGETCVGSGVWDDACGARPFPACR